MSPGAHWLEDGAAPEPEPDERRAEVPLSADMLWIEADGHCLVQGHGLERVEKSPAASSGAVAWCRCGRKFWLRRREAGGG